MPIYEFSCSKCGREFEELTFGDDKPQCPHCGSADTEKLISACARRARQGGGDSGGSSSSSGCGSCSGGNCASCCH